jgi:hypothetical protein
MKQVVRSATSLILVLVAGGCGSSDPLGVGVSGMVTYKGQPIKEGLIAFIPMDGTNGPTGGANIDDGKYAIPRRGALAPGKYRVEIRAFEETGKESPKNTQQSQMFGRSVEKVSAAPDVAQELARIKMERKNVVPDRYNVNSELTNTLPDETQVTVDFEL